MNDASRYRFTQIYRMPGEGLIAEFRRGEETLLYDMDGLRYRIMNRRGSGEDTSEEEKALAVLGNLEGS